MTEREREERQYRYTISGNCCEVCGKHFDTYGQRQIAHCIAQTKTNISKYGSFFIQHRLNYRAVCSLKCNDACNIGYNKGKILMLLADIIMYEIKRFDT
jgi:hypothetical protein